MKPRKKTNVLTNVSEVSDDPKEQEIKKWWSNLSPKDRKLFPSIGMILLPKKEQAK